jgi:hypothetical protein
MCAGARGPSSAGKGCSNQERLGAALDSERAENKQEGLGARTAGRAAGMAMGSITGLAARDLRDELPVGRAHSRCAGARA